MIKYSAFLFKMRVLLLSCGIKDEKMSEPFIQYSYRKYINPRNKETEEDKRNRHHFQRITTLMALRHKLNEYTNLIANEKTEQNN